MEQGAYQRRRIYALMSPEVPVLNGDDCIHVKFGKFVEMHEMLVGGKLRIYLPYRLFTDRFSVHIPAEQGEYAGCYHRQ